MSAPTIPTHSELRARLNAVKESGSYVDSILDAYGHQPRGQLFKDIAEAVSLLDQIAAYREALESIVQQATIADDPEHHTLGFVRIRADQALSIPSTDSGRDT